MGLAVSHFGTFSADCKPASAIAPQAGSQNAPTKSSAYGVDEGARRGSSSVKFHMICEL